MTLPAERRGWYDHLKTSSDELIDAAYFIAHRVLASTIFALPPRACCQKVTSAPNSGRSNCCSISKTPCNANPKSAKKMLRSHWETLQHCKDTNLASGSAFALPSKPYFGKTILLSSHVFIRSKKRKPNKWIQMVDEAESTKTTGSINSSD